GTSYASGNPILPEGLPHFMEHGGVWVLFQCDAGCPSFQSQERDLNTLVQAELAKGMPVSLASYPPAGVAKPAHPINVIAWQYMLSLDSVDKAAIQSFIEEHACQYLPEAFGFGCPQVQRGDSLPAKDA